MYTQHVQINSHPEKMQVPPSPPSTPGAAGLRRILALASRQAASADSGISIITFSGLGLSDAVRFICGCLLQGSAEHTPTDSCFDRFGALGGFHSGGTKNLKLVMSLFPYDLAENIYI